MTSSDDNTAPSAVSRLEKLSRRHWWTMPDALETFSSPLCPVSGSECQEVVTQKNLDTCYSRCLQQIGLYTAGSTSIIVSPFRHFDPTQVPYTSSIIPTLHRSGPGRWHLKTDCRRLYNPLQNHFKIDDFFEASFHYRCNFSYRCLQYHRPVQTGNRLKLSS